MNVTDVMVEDASGGGGGITLEGGLSPYSCEDSLPASTRRPGRDNPWRGPWGPGFSEPFHWRRWQWSSLQHHNMRRDIHTSGITLIMKRDHTDHGWWSGCCWEKIIHITDCDDVEKIIIMVLYIYTHTQFKVLYWEEYYDCWLCREKTKYYECWTQHEETTHITNMIGIIWMYKVWYNIKV